MKSTRDAYGETLVKIGKENRNVVVLDADLSESTRTKLFAREFPDRFFNFGVAEQNMIGTAAGFALSGKIPFASTFAIFASGRAWDQLRVSVSYSNAPVNVVASHGGVSVGEDGYTHHAIEDIALMRVLPNMTVMVPADAVETEKMLWSALEWKKPVYIRTGRQKVPIICDSCDFEIGKANVLRDGGDVAIIATGNMVAEAMKAADMLKEKGISALILNIHTIKPIDSDAIIKAARNTGCIITVEDHSIVGGLGSAVAEATAENYPVHVTRIGVPDVFSESGPGDSLLEKFGMTAGSIAQKCMEVRR
ncbi:MAG: transketolase family protein [Candidatus Aenigmarchaeota archaeon]|nr:transketolase family protein [Candidatus Aenigmarchaeota archaeon]